MGADRKVPKLIEKHSITIGLVTLATVFLFITGFAYKVGGAEREMRDKINQNSATLDNCKTNFEKHVEDNEKSKAEMRAWMREVNKNLTKINSELEHLNEKVKK